LRNLANKNIYKLGKNGGYNAFISFILSMAVKAAKEQFDTVTKQIILVGTNANVVFFFRLRQTGY